MPADGKPLSKDRAPHPIFSDIRVRKAVACYGMDRKEIVKIAYKGAGHTVARDHPARHHGRGRRQSDVSV